MSVCIDRVLQVDHVQCCVCEQFCGPPGDQLLIACVECLAYNEQYQYDTPQTTESVCGRMSGHELTPDFAAIGTHNFIHIINNH